jgi:hypothetical protein
MVTSLLILGVSIAGAGGACAQYGSAESARAPITLSQDSWTVLTVAPDGAFGTATDDLINRAIAGAIAKCRTMSRHELGCGARFTAVQAGWSLGLRCGREVIIAADTDIAVAEQAAKSRETALRQFPGSDLPACRRLVTVGPTGRILTPETATHIVAPAAGSVRRAAP